MDVRSKLKLFNSNIFVYSGSCTTDDGEEQPIFNKWSFPGRCEMGGACDVFASHEWVEACAFFKKIEACGFLYSGSCGFRVETTDSSHLALSSKGCFSVQACGLQIGSSCFNIYRDNVEIGASCHDVCISANEVITLCANSCQEGENPAYVQIGYYDTEEPEKAKIKISSDEIDIYSESYPLLNVPDTAQPSADSIVTKSYVDNATAIKFSCTYTDTEEHTISIGEYGICFSPEKIQIHGCGGSLVVGGESDDSVVVFDLDSHFSKVPFVSAPSLCLTDGFGSAYFATEAYVDARINPEFEQGFTVGNGACVVDVSTNEDVIIFNETELPTTGGTVLTSENIYNKIPMPCTCVWWLEPKSPDENGKITWTCELMYNGQYANSDIPPNVVVARIDESNPDKFHYVDADVSFGTYGDVGVIYSSYITVDMNSNEAIPQCTFKVTISNIHTNNQLT